MTTTKLSDLWSQILHRSRDDTEVERISTLIVDDWFDRAYESLDNLTAIDPSWLNATSGELAEDIACLAYEVLATQQGLARMDVNSDHDILSLTEDLNREIAPVTKQLTQHASHVFNSSMWLQCAEEHLKALSTEPQWHQQTARRARELICELDDAQLVLSAIQRFNPQAGTDLGASLLELEPWPADHAYAFLPCARFLCALTRTFSPSIENLDPHLFLTTLKFIPLLEAVDDACFEQCLLDVLASDLQGFVSSNASTTHVTPKLARVYELKPKLEARGQWYQAGPSPIANRQWLVATGSSQVRQSRRLEFKWHCCDEPRRWEAYMFFNKNPLHAKDDDFITLHLLGAPVEGTIVVHLAGIYASAEAEGGAAAFDFSFGQLRHTWNDEVPELIVEFATGSGQVDVGCRVTIKNSSD